MLLSAHIHKFLIVFRALTFFKAYNGIFSDGTIGTFLFIVKKYINKYASAHLCSPLVVLSQANGELQLYCKISSAAVRAGMVG